MRLPLALLPLRHSTFRALWLAYVVASIGTWMQNTGAGWLMTSLAPNALVVSMVQAATILPVFLLALPAGALADIIDRRRYLLGTQLWMLIAAIILAVLTLAHQTTAVSLLLLTFAIGVGGAMNNPAWGAVVPEVVPRDDLVQAIALNGIGFNLARAVGPAIAGFIVVLAGSGACFALYALSFLGTIGVVLFWRRRTPRHTLPPEHMLSAMRAGVQFARHTAAMRAAIVRGIAYYLPAAAPWAMLPLIVREQLHLGAGVFGVLLGLMGLGAVGCGLLLPRLRQVAGRGGLTVAASIASCVGEAALALSHHWLAAALAMLIFGVGWVTAGASTQAAAQLVAPPWVRARALALYQLATNGSLAAGSFLWGWLGTVFGLPMALALAAATGLVAIIATLSFSLDAPVAPPLPAMQPQPPSPVPGIGRALRRARGRVLETMRYRVTPADREAFLTVMAEVRHVRGRAGALLWQLYEDVANPDGWLEIWTMADWTDHLRERSRLSDDDKAVLARSAAWKVRDAPPHSRYIAVEPGQKMTRNVA